MSASFETLRYPTSDGDDPWMLRSPVFRSVAAPSGRRSEPLFPEHKPRKLNCLIVMSLASGKCVSTNDSGEVLDRASYDALTSPAECESVRQALAGAGACVNEPKVLGTEEDPLTLDLLEQTLRSREWDIIHYIGHTDCRNDLAYFVFPGTRPNECQR